MAASSATTTTKTGAGVKAAASAAFIWNEYRSDSGPYRYVWHARPGTALAAFTSAGFAGRTPPLALDAGSISTHVFQVGGVGLFALVDPDGPCQSGVGVKPVCNTSPMTGLSSMAGAGNSAVARAFAGVAAGQALFRAVRLAPEL